MSYIFYAQGHPEVRSTHPSTIEITKESHLTTGGDCIIAVNSSLGARDLPQRVKRSLTTQGGRITLVLSTGPFQFRVQGQGDRRLTLSHPTDLVIRKSSFMSDRTIMIRSDKSANDLPRGMVRLLQDPKNRLEIEISTASQGRFWHPRRSAI